MVVQEEPALMIFTVMVQLAILAQLLTVLNVLIVEMEKSIAGKSVRQMLSVA